MAQSSTVRAALTLAALPALLAGCAGRAALTDRECMTRVMYFESNRSSQEGMVAVGTTVMNRLATPGYPKTVCGVVGQPNQFAAGVLDKPMAPRQAERIAAVADAVLAGERHPQVGSAMFFHTAGMSFPYNNMHYVAVAGGNAFYEKLQPGTFVNTISPYDGSITQVAARPVPSSALFARQPPTTLAEVIARSLGFGDQPRRKRRPPTRYGRLTGDARG